MGIKGVSNKIKSNSFDDSIKFWSNNISNYMREEERSMVWRMRVVMGPVENFFFISTFFIFSLNFYFIYTFIEWINNKKIFKNHEFLIVSYLNFPRKMFWLIMFVCVWVGDMFLRLVEKHSEIKLYIIFEDEVNIL